VVPQKNDTLQKHLDANHKTWQAITEIGIGSLPSFITEAKSTSQLQSPSLAAGPAIVPLNGLTRIRGGLKGGDDLEVVADEDVVRPVHADIVNSYSPLLSSTTRSTMPPG